MSYILVINTLVLFDNRNDFLVMEQVELVVVVNAKLAIAMLATAAMAEK